MIARNTFARFSPRRFIATTAANVPSSVLPEVRQKALATSKLRVHRMTDQLNQLRAQTSKITGSPSSPSTSAALSGGKKMSDSFVQAFLPFRSDPSLREEYVNSHGRIRVGKVLEDLDALAACSAYLHCSGSARPLTIVTASVDRIDMLHEVPLNEDISVFAYVTYVGKSSMEVTLQMETVLPDSIAPEEMDPFKYSAQKVSKDKLSGELLLNAKFIMVARDSETQKAASVHQLLLETNEERALFRQGAEHKARKQVAAQTSLSQRPPSIEEMTLVHNLYKEYMQYLDTTKEGDPSTPPLQKPDNVVWMRDTRNQTINLTFPQDRNLHSKIFGGFLMRRAYELSIVTGMAFSTKSLQFRALDDITFRKPVEIGAILDLHSQVVYTHGADLVVKVVAHVVDPASKRMFLSNEFWFTFTVAQEERVEGEVYNRIMPRSYNDCMMYLEGKRRFEGV
ncbi:Acyl-coenzyme A thioesterase 9, mitochondrial [Rhizoclosmatium sp. JEL0117]|nr:Acyl-coenzyme A thioesterase 9, mitochondrial [Rhizoclosmatium sp. JEL0117]